MECFASKWKKGDNTKLDYHKLLKPGKLSPIKELHLCDNPDPKKSKVKI